MKSFYKKTKGANKFLKVTYLSAVLFLISGFYSHAQNYSVTDFNDGTATNQLRGAIQAADAAGGTHTITLTAGTYNLSQGEIVFGNTAENITIQVASSGSATINMTTTNQDRIFLINPSGTNPNVVVTVSNITFKGGTINLNSPDGDGTYGGGAILAGGPSNSLTLTSCSFQNNSAPSSTGNAGAVEYNGGGTLNIDQCTFTSNSCVSGNGGAVRYFLENGVGNGSVNITNSAFTSNSITSSSAGGGALAIGAQGTSGGTTFTATVVRNTFTSNQATASNSYGGAIDINNAYSSGNTVTVQYNRFVNNTANITTASALAMNYAQGSVDATNNWWGCNGGPASCADKSAIVGTGSGGGSLNLTKWLELKVSGSPASVCPSSASTVTASFLSNSNNDVISASNLRALWGVPISFTATNGTLSGAQTTIQTTGTATVNFTGSGTPGTGTVNAVVDNVPANDATAKVSITINTPGTWTGTVSSSWFNAGNWNCGVPTSATNVTISSGAPNMPVIDNTGAIANNITINGGASLTFSGNNLLEVQGTISGAGTFNPSNGSLKLSGTSVQSLPAGNYYNLFIEGGSVKNLAGSVTVSNVLTLASGVVDLGSSNLTITNTGSISGGSSSSYIRTSGTGKLVQNSLGATGRTGSILFPVGSSTDYTPMRINNAGTTDNFDVRVIDNVYPSYSSEVPGGSAAASNVVKKTWFINEAVAGGSNVTLTFQWNSSDEATGFQRGVGYASHYNTTSNSWQPILPAPGASGSDPYTLSQSGITSFSPFGVGSGTSVLPLQLLSFTGNLVNQNVVLNWRTTNEVNVKKFVIQKATDNNSVTTTGELDALNTSGDHSYTFTDLSLSQTGWNTSQYKLLIVDMDGRTTESNILQFVNRTKQPFITIGHNPFFQQLPLNIYVSTLASSSISLFDINGKKVLQTDVNLQAGLNTIRLNTSSLLSGVYVLKVQSGGELYTARVVKLGN